MRRVHLFCGHDPREAIGFHVFVSSVIERASLPVAVHAIGSRGGPVGSNAFTYSRFDVPLLMGYQGQAIFADASDMLMCADIADLAALFDSRYPVQVVKRADYRTRHARKYVGTGMECDNFDYARKNWASLMLMNCAHPYWLARRAGLDQLQFAGLADEQIGALPERWNRLVDEGDAVDGAALLHWTAGIAAFPHYVNAPGAALWFAQRANVMRAAA
jgi:hypothetical protein